MIFTRLVKIRAGYEGGGVKRKHLDLAVLVAVKKREALPDLALLLLRKFMGLHVMVRAWRFARAGLNFSSNRTPLFRATATGIFPSCAKSTRRQPGPKMRNLQIHLLRMPGLHPIREYVQPPNRPATKLDIAAPRQGTSLCFPHPVQAPLPCCIPLDHPMSSQTASSPRGAFQPDAPPWGTSRKHFVGRLLTILNAVSGFSTNSSHVVESVVHFPLRRRVVHVVPI